MSRQQTKIPVTLIAGFLGAGKTTLLNYILSENHGLRAAVLVNDFGAINIDAKLVIGVEGDAVSLANGCICCSIRDDLVGACLRLLERPDLPDHILVEMSGVSDPVPVLNTFTETRLADAFAINSILTVVDADQRPDWRGRRRGRHGLSSRQPTSSCSTRWTSWTGSGSILSWSSCAWRHRDRESSESLDAGFRWSWFSPKVMWWRMGHSGRSVGLRRTHLMTMRSPHGAGRATARFL